MRRPCGLAVRVGWMSVPAAWTRRSLDDVETLRAKSLCGYEGRIFIPLLYLSVMFMLRE